MRKIKNKIVTGIMLAMMAFCVTDGAKAALAGNIADTAWSFNLSVNNKDPQYTETRGKQDYSYMYVNWQYSYNTLSRIKVSPLAVNSYGTRVGAGYKNSTAERWVILNLTGEYRVTNYVKENGYNNACFGMLGETGSGYATGLWSPDSVGTAPIL